VLKVVETPDAPAAQAAQLTTLPPIALPNGATARPALVQVLARDETVDLRA
jgi:hypothetical protein